jgi:hypothetical protein
MKGDTVVLGIEDNAHVTDLLGDEPLGLEHLSSGGPNSVLHSWKPGHIERPHRVTRQLESENGPVKPDGSVQIIDMDLELPHDIVLDVHTFQTTGPRLSRPKYSNSMGILEIGPVPGICPVPQDRCRRGAQPKGALLAPARMLKTRFPLKRGPANSDKDLARFLKKRPVRGLT